MPTTRFLALLLFCFLFFFFLSIVLLLSNLPLSPLLSVKLQQIFCTIPFIIKNSGALLQDSLHCLGTEEV